MTGCQSLMPGLFQTVDDIATDTAVQIQVDKAAIQKDTDIIISVKVQNKDGP